MTIRKPQHRKANNCLKIKENAHMCLFAKPNSVPKCIFAGIVMAVVLTRKSTSY